MIAAPELPLNPTSVAEKAGQLGDLLVSMGKLSARDLERAVSVQAEAGGVL